MLINHGDGTGSRVTIPNEMIKNLGAIMQRNKAAAAKTKAAAAPAPALPPVPPSRAETSRGQTLQQAPPTTGFKVPPWVTTPPPTQLRPRSRGIPEQ